MSTTQLELYLQGIDNREDYNQRSQRRFRLVSLLWFYDVATRCWDHLLMQSSAIIAWSCRGLYRYKTYIISYTIQAHHLQFIVKFHSHLQRVEKSWLATDFESKRRPSWKLVSYPISLLGGFMIALGYINSSWISYLLQLVCMWLVVWTIFKLVYCLSIESKSSIAGNATKGNTRNYIVYTADSTSVSRELHLEYSALGNLQHSRSFFHLFFLWTNRCDEESALSAIEAFGRRAWDVYNNSSRIKPS